MNQSKKYIALFCFISIAFCACAQNRYGIKKSYSFFREQFPGNIPVDGQGNPLIHGPDTVFIAMIEMDTSVNIIWKNAYFKKQTFNVYKAEIDFPFQYKEGSGEKKQPEMKPQPGHKMVFLSLQKTDIDTMPKAVAQKIKNKNSFLLKGKYMDKTIFYQLPVPKELEAIPHY